jgi:hypothetical protein
VSGCVVGQRDSEARDQEFGGRAVRAAGGWDDSCYVLGVGTFLPGSFLPAVATNATQSPWFLNCG